MEAAARAVRVESLKYPTDIDRVLNPVYVTKHLESAVGRRVKTPWPRTKAREKAQQVRRIVAMKERVNVYVAN